MSIATEITRIQNAKTSIKAAIEGKGVTVPADTHLDGMAAFINAIQSGGADLSSLTWTTITSETTRLSLTMPASGWSTAIIFYRLSSGGCGIDVINKFGSDAMSMNLWASSWKLSGTMDGLTLEWYEQGDMMWGGGDATAVLDESIGAYAILE